MNRRSLVAAAAVCAAALALSVILTKAGPLDPPAGPVGPTFKTLQEVEPRIPVGPDTTPGDADSLFKITEPGSYYLTGNIEGVAGKHGVEIASSDVTLDLNGFALLGAAGSLSGVRAEGAPGALRQITVVNGSATGWGGSGVDLREASHSTVRLVRAINNRDGIRAGNDSVVDRCIASNNDINGIVTGGSCVITQSSAMTNNSFPLSGGFFFQLGERGVEAGAGSRVEACNIQNNADGLVVGDNSQVRYTLFYNNVIAGIDNVISGGGFTAGNGSDVFGCLAYSNGLVGVAVGKAGSIASCMTSNTVTSQDILGSGGFVAGAGSTVKHNFSYNNSGDIVVTDDNVLVDGNYALSAGLVSDLGIAIRGDRNMIIRNVVRTRSSSSPFSIADNNVVGVVVVPPFSDFVNGSSGGSGLGTLDPFANIVY